MAKQQFNPEEYFKLKHRIETLRSRIELDTGSEQEQARRLLAKVERKLSVYEETHEIPKQAYEESYESTKRSANSYSTSASSEFWDFVRKVYQEYSDYTQYQYEWNPNPNFHWQVHFEQDNNYHEDVRSEAEMVSDLGILYAIFGSTYQTVLNYHVYKIRFKKQIDKKGAFYRVRSDIYEDNIRICKDINIGFWPFRYGDDKCGDMEFSCMSNHDISKYNNGCSVLFTKLLEGLADIWNLYFDDQGLPPLLPGTVSNFRPYANNTPEVQLNPEQRKAVIDKVENEIDSGKLEYLSQSATKLQVMAYHKFHILSTFLEESGVVYKVDSSGVYIWDHWKKNFGKLVGYDYDKSRSNYTLYLL